MGGYGRYFYYFRGWGIILRLLVTPNILHEFYQLLTTFIYLNILQFPHIYSKSEMSKKTRNEL